jgi:hypothetical protein
MIIEKKQEEAEQKATRKTNRAGVKEPTIISTNNN